MNAFDCTDIKALISALIDDQLDEHTRHVVERHLAECEACRSSIDRYEQLDALVAMSGEVDMHMNAGLPRGFEDAVLARAVRADGAGDTWGRGRAAAMWMGWLAAAASVGFAAVIWTFESAPRSQERLRWFAAADGAGQILAGRELQDDARNLRKRAEVGEPGMPDVEVEATHMASMHDTSETSNEERAVSVDQADIARKRFVSRPPQRDGFVVPQDLRPGDAALASALMPRNSDRPAATSSKRESVRADNQHSMLLASTPVAGASPAVESGPGEVREKPYDVGGLVAWRPAPPITREESDAIYNASILLDLLSDADLSSFADVERIRRVVEADELIERLREARQHLEAADRPAILAAEAVLLRIARGPLDQEDVRQLRETAAQLYLAREVGEITRRWDQAHSL